jgi:hypothetical protein
MKSKILPTTALLASSLVFSAGCATRTTPSGGKETTLLGGAVTVATNSFQPPAATTATVDTTKLVGQGNPSGAKTTLLWGLITLHDY